MSKELKFREFNANPKGKKTSDCVVRALTIATGLSYKEVYKELFEISLKSGYMLNEKRVEDKFMELHGFIKHKQPRKYDNTKYKVKEILSVCTKDIIVVRVAHHLTCVKNGELVDTWNCGYKTINNYYTLR